MNCFLGVDPGLTGAIAFYFPAAPGRVSAEDVPSADGVISGTLLFERIKQMRPDVAWIESVHAMPGQGVSSTFKFGRAFGTVIGAVQSAGVPLHFVTPGKWKRHFGLGADKEQARELAQRMFPGTPEHFTLKKHHGRAEAALIALYGSQVKGGWATEAAR